MEQFVETIQAEPVELKVLGIRDAAKEELLGQPAKKISARSKISNES